MVECRDILRIGPQKFIQVVMWTVRSRGRGCRVKRDHNQQHRKGEVGERKGEVGKTETQAEVGRHQPPRHGGSGQAPHRDK